MNNSSATPSSVPLKKGQINVQSHERLEEVFSSLESELLGTLYYLIGNMEDARDALQDAFIRCWKHKEEIPQIENLKGWVFRITYNIGRDARKTAWKRRKKPFPEDEALLMAREANPDAEMTHQEQVALVRRALLDLSDDEKDVFLLRENGELTYEDIAETLKIPVGTAKTRMKRAIVKMQQILSKHEPDL